MPPFTFICPICHSTLEAPSPDVRVCPKDKETYKLIDGIWRFLPTWRAWKFDRFIKLYDYILEEERWGSIDHRHYLDLPRCHPGHPHARDWRPKAADYQALVQKVIRPLSKRLGRALTVLDLGAGNGWLSNRLSELNHQVAAVDIRVHRRTGLGVNGYYQQDFTCLQADFDHLPLCDKAIDLVIFNDSIHYATDYATTLPEAIRVLQPAGRLVVMGSPMFNRRENGYKMVNVYEDYHMERFGFMLDSLDFEHFFTQERLGELIEQLGLRQKRYWSQSLPTRISKQTANWLPAARFRILIHPDAYIQQVARQERDVKRLFGQLFEIEHRWRWRRPEQPKLPIMVFERAE